jgi:hypothetical protein
VVGRTPLEHRIYLKPGLYRLTIDAPGQGQLVRVITPAAGATVEVSMVPIPPAVVPARPASSPVARATGSEQPPAAPPPRPKARFYRTWWFWTIVGAVVVGGTVGAVVATQGGDSRMPRGEEGLPVLRWYQ